MVLWNDKQMSRALARATAGRSVPSLRCKDGAQDDIFNLFAATVSALP
jgi:hypothetical protein